MRKHWFITYHYHYGAGVFGVGSKKFYGTEDELQEYISKFDESYCNFHWSEIKAR